MNSGMCAPAEGDRGGGQTCVRGAGKSATHTHSQYLSFLLSVSGRGHSRTPTCVADVFHERGGQLGCSCPNRRTLGRGGERLSLEGAGDDALGKGQTPQDSSECGNCPGRHVRNVLRRGIGFPPRPPEGRSLVVFVRLTCLYVCERRRRWYATERRRNNSVHTQIQTQLRIHSSIHSRPVHLQP